MELIKEFLPVFPIIVCLGLFYANFIWLSLLSAVPWLLILIAGAVCWPHLPNSATSVIVIGSVCYLLVFFMWFLLVREVK